MSLDSAPRLRAMWRDNPNDPGRLPATDVRVRRLLTEFGLEGPVRDLGGTMSLNVLVEDAGLVLRVHQPWVSRPRLLALQRLRHALRDRGHRVATATPFRGDTLIRCGNRWAELEPYLEAEKPSPSPAAYRWLFATLGALHRDLAQIDVTVPRPQVATFATPATLARWLALAAPVHAVALGEPDEVAALGNLIRRLRRAWPSLDALPAHVIHGDARLGNLRLADDGQPLVLDLGFAATRSRAWDVAYSLLYMVLGLGGRVDPEAFDWSFALDCVTAYEAGLGSRLRPVEWRALAPFMAAVPLYHAVTAGFLLDPEEAVRSAFKDWRLSDWLLAQPDVLCASR